MHKIFNVYCDESCHLENDNASVMTLAATWCLKSDARNISKNIMQIKLKHGLSKFFEIKWTKVSPAKLDFYLDLVEYFFEEPALHFRAIVVPDKTILNHSVFNQSHDQWYYKMFFRLLEVIIDPSSSYNVYIDIKDTRSEESRRKLENCLKNASYDNGSRKIVEKVQQIRSHESQILQYADLFTGALRYCNERLNNSSAKLELIDKIKKSSRKSLLQTTWPKESKFNILIWQAGGKES